MSHFCTRTFLFLLWTFVPLTFVDAASLYIDPPFAELNRGDAIELSVRLDVDEEAGECINAVDAVLSYGSSISPVDISTGDSIFSIWVEQPVIDREARTITFAGGMPNGYCGRVTGDPRLTNRLVNIIFRAPGFSVGGGDTDNSVGSVAFTEQTTAYLNDGFGTAIAPRTLNAELTINPRAGSTIEDPWREAVDADTTPPEQFSISLNREEVAFHGRYYIVFNTTDKQTGIDQYQVMEEPIEQFASFDWGRADAPWVTARSPYVLEDQSLNSTIRVRAIDKAGNEYIATLLPDESLRTASDGQVLTYIIFGVIGLIALGCVIVVFVFVQQRRRKKREAAEDADISEREDEFEDNEVTEDEEAEIYEDTK